MTNSNSRRDFIKKSAILSSAIVLPTIINATSLEADFPIVDYHVHLTREFTIEKAMELSKKINVKFGIVEHPGPRAAIRTDEDLKNYIEKLGKYPVFTGVQPIVTGWSRDFSNDMVNQLDFILMDADTVPLRDGKFLAIWRHNNYIENLDEFMEIYMNHIENILKYEPITIFARPTYLPVNFGRYYDKVWTNQRITKIIDLAKAKNIALEISTPIHVPGKKFILQAKEAGLKFTFGTNARNNDAGKVHYGLQLVKECNLTRDDMLWL